ncbi:MAG: serine/threonine protein phosphatase [Planctomycetales bacterium]|nr:serine/threonine protein phosphatase [Planctomycetales bacterium]
MSGRLIAIGDIHGCSDALRVLLNTIQPESDDTIVTLGDYVDRGPNSKDVIEQLIALKQKCVVVCLQGNHEEMMLRVVRDEEPPYNWLRYGGVETLDSYGFVGDMKCIPPEHFAFFDTMAPFYESEEHIFLHANYDPGQELEKQTEFHLRWLKLTESTPGPHMSGKRAVVGHTHDRGGEIFDVGHLVCIDTYCYGGGWLTGLEVRTGELWQVDFNGRLRNS